MAVQSISKLLRPSGDVANKPLDARTEVNSYNDLQNLTGAYVGMHIYAKNNYTDSLNVLHPKGEYVVTEIDSYGDITEVTTAEEYFNIPKIDENNKLSADLIQNGEINKVVTQSEKDAWNNPSAKVTYVGTNETTGFPAVDNPVADVIYACLKLTQDQGINSAYNFYTYKEGNWQNISQGPVGPQGQTGATGPANTLSIGTVTDGEQAAASITGDAPNQTLNLTFRAGKSAYQVAVDNGYVGSEEQWLASLKANIGAFKFVANVPAVETAFEDATTGGIGTTYTSDINGITADASTASLIILMNTANATPAKTYMIATQDNGSGGFEFVYAGDLQNAMPSNVLIEDDIDNTNLENPVEGSLAKASDVAPLKGKLKDVDYDEREYTVDNGGIVVNINSYVTASGNTAGTYHPSVSSSLNRKSAEINVEGYDKISFIGVTYKSNSNNVNWGYAFYANYEDTQSIEGCYGVFDRVTEGEQTITPTPYTLDVPTGAKVLRFTFSMSSSSHLDESDLWAKVVKGASISKMIENAVDELEEETDGKFESVNESIEEINDILLKEVYVEQTSESVDEKHFYNLTGEYKGSERINIEKYAIEEGKRYFFSGKMAPTQNYPCVAYLNGEEEWIGNDSYRGGSEYSWDKKPLTIPPGAAYICLQVARSYTELWKLYSLETQPWDLGGVNEAIEDLDSRVTVIEQGSQAETLDTKLMKVVIKDGEILVRSRHSDTEDILIRMKDNTLYGSDKRKNSLTFDSVYIAPKETPSESDMMDSQYEIVSVEDSVGALGVVGFYYLYAQHGWTIPCGSNLNNLFSQADIGSVWKGARGEAYNNKEFVVAHVDNSKVYFVPVCELGPNGVYISSWDKDTDNYPTSFTYDRGGEDGHHTGTINLNTDRFDLCVQTSSRKYVVDGIEVGNGTYFCDDFVFNEYVLGHNPATVQPPNWFEETIPYNGELVNWCRSFVFKGSSVTLNESIDVVNPFELSVFYGCVPQMPMQYSITDGDVTVTYNSYTFIPKVKRDGRDAPFETNNGHATVTGSKNISHLYDVNNLPDRIITFLKNDVIGYKVGMASGLSLVHGITTKTNRNLLLRDYNSTIYTFGGDTASIKNKFFTRTLVPEAFDNNIVTTAFVKDFSCYYCWYNPNNNEDGLQVYTYKDGNSYVVYVHAWVEFDKVAINLPPYLNGLSVSGIIEKTEGAELLNDIVSCNKLYCSFSTNESGEKNYIVFQVK